MPPRYQSASLDRVAQARQALYRLLASLFFYPEAPRLQALAGVALALDRQALAGFGLFPAWRRLVEALSSLSTDALPRLQGEYTSLFLRSTQEGSLPPREGVCRGLSGADMGLLLARLQERYRDAGLAPSSGYPPDHASVELEFMAYLCEHEGQAWQSRDLPSVVATLEREKAFLEEHLVQWFPPFARALSRQGASPFYAIVGEGASAFVLHEQGLVHAVMTHVRTGTASPLKGK